MCKWNKVKQVMSQVLIKTCAEKTTRGCSQPYEIESQLNTLHGACQTRLITLHIIILTLAPMDRMGSGLLIHNFTIPVQKSRKADVHSRWTAGLPPLVLAASRPHGN